MSCDCRLRFHFRLRSRSRFRFRSRFRLSLRVLGGRTIPSACSLREPLLAVAALLHLVLPLPPEVERGLHVLHAPMLDEACSGGVKE